MDYSGKIQNGHPVSRNYQGKEESDEEPKGKRCHLPASMAGRGAERTHYADGT